MELSFVCLWNKFLFIMWSFVIVEVLVLMDELVRIYLLNVLLLYIYDNCIILVVGFISYRNF